MLNSLPIAIFVFAQALAADPQSMVSPTPEGFQVSTVQAGSAYEKAGIHPGDLLLEVNHRAMRTDADLQWMTEQLKGKRRVSLKIKRDGKIELLHYYLK